jgi:hypothetical protein
VESGYSIKLVNFQGADADPNAALGAVVNVAAAIAKMGQSNETAS